MIITYYRCVGLRSAPELPGGGVEEVILLTGDGDFQYPVDTLRRANKIITLISYRR